MSDLSRREMATCEGCEYTYDTGPDWWQRCPNCHPEQSKPLGVRLMDPEERMGPDYVWLECRGPRGRWAPIGELFIADRESVLGPMRELAELMPDIEGHELLLPAVVERVRRMREACVVLAADAEYEMIDERGSPGLDKPTRESICESIEGALVPCTRRQLDADCPGWREWWPR